MVLNAPVLTSADEKLALLVVEASLLPRLIIEFVFGLNGEVSFAADNPEQIHEILGLNFLVIGRF